MRNQILHVPVDKIYANDGAFAALKTDGTIVTWGNEELGGSSRFVTGGALSGIVNLADVFTNQLIGNKFTETIEFTDLLTSLNFWHMLNTTNGIEVK